MQSPLTAALLHVMQGREGVLQPIVKVVWLWERMEDAVVCVRNNVVKLHCG